MDQVDLAELLITENLERAIAAARGIRKKTRTNSPPVKKCVECNELIPAKRRKIVRGCIRCVECEEDYEKHNRRKKRSREDYGALDSVIDDIHLASL